MRHSSVGPAGGTHAEHEGASIMRVHLLGNRLYKILTASNACGARAYMHMRTDTHSHTQTQAPTHAPTHTHTLALALTFKMIGLQFHIGAVSHTYTHTRAHTHAAHCIQLKHHTAFNIHPKTAPNLWSSSIYRHTHVCT